MPIVMRSMKPAANPVPSPSPSPERTGNGDLVASSATIAQAVQAARPQVPQSATASPRCDQLPQDLPTDLPSDAHWYQILDLHGQLHCCQTLAGVCDLIVGGHVDVNSPAREAYHSPARSNELEYTTWKERTSWRPLKSSLVPTYFTIHALFDPCGANIKHAMRWTTVLMACLWGGVWLWHEASVGFTELGSFAHLVLGDMKPTGRAFLFVITIYGLVVCTGATILGCLTGGPLGWLLGYLSYVCGVGRRASAVPHSKLNPDWTIQGAWLAVLAIAIDLTGVGLVYSRPTFKGPAVSPTFGPQHVADSQAPLPVVDNSRSDYRDPKGRFRCTVGSSWQITEKAQDPRSNITFASGSMVISVLARETTGQAVDQSMIGELRARFTADTERNRVHLERLDMTIVERCGVPAIASEIRIDRPKLVIGRQYKLVKHGRDHVIGMMVENPSEAEANLAKLEEFLLHYEPLSQAEDKP